MKIHTVRQRCGTTLMTAAIWGVASTVAVTFWGGSAPGARRAAGQSAGAAPSADSELLDSPDSIEDMPSGVFGEADLPRLPVLPMREAPPHVQATVKAMSDAYEHLQRSAPYAGASAVLEAPDSAQAPPRVDSGDPDPDRVHAPAPAASSR